MADLPVPCEPGSVLRARRLTTAEWNALPESVRNYIAAMETECDPANTLRSLMEWRENAMALVKELESHATSIGDLLKERVHVAEARAFVEAIHEHFNYCAIEGEEGAEHDDTSECFRCWAASILKRLDATPRGSEGTSGTDEGGTP